MDSLGTGSGALHQNTIGTNFPSTIFLLYLFCGKVFMILHVFEVFRIVLIFSELSSATTRRMCMVSRFVVAISHRIFYIRDVGMLRGGGIPSNGNKNQSSNFQSVEVAIQTCQFSKFQSFDVSKIQHFYFIVWEK